PMSSPSALRVVTMVTPVANVPSASRNWRDRDAVSTVMLGTCSGDSLGRSSPATGGPPHRRRHASRHGGANPDAVPPPRTRHCMFCEWDHSLEVQSQPQGADVALHSTVKYAIRLAEDPASATFLMRIRILGQYVHGSLAVLAAAEAAMLCAAMSLAIVLRL